jgi:hypothetical protein
MTDTINSQNIDTPWNTLYSKTYTDVSEKPYLSNSSQQDTCTYTFFA